MEAGYNKIDLVDLGQIDDEGNGGFVGASFGFLEHFHVFGRYASNNTDELDADVTHSTAGGGWHGLLGQKADLIVDLAWFDQGFEPAGSSGSPKMDDDGYFARVGARWRPIKLIEIGGWIRYQDVGEFGDDDVYEASAIVHLWRVGVGLAVETQGDIDIYNGFVRINFGL